MINTFRSLSNRNYRLWAGGALVSNIGTWMQRIAQDWLVLTELTDHSATAVGAVTALQFGPQLLLLPVTGYVADHFDRRKVLLATQTAMGLLALGLGLLTLSGSVTLWQVYGFAFALGCVSAFDAPARQTFVAELVGESALSNAVALNSTSFNAARMIGPAVAGLLIAGVGTGWVFMINAGSFAAVLIALGLLRVDDLHRGDRGTRERGRLTDGFHYVRRRPDLIAVLLMLLLIGTFGLNFAIYISTMAVSVYHTGAGTYGLLTSTMAIGSIIGSLLSAHRERPDITHLLVSAAAFCVACSVAAAMPDELLFSLVLVAVGVAAQNFTTTTMSLMQLTTTPAMRGRVMAIVMAIAMGGTPIGAPIVGWIADTFGPRWALFAGGLSGFGAALVAVRHLVRHRGLRIHFSAGRWACSMDALDQGASTLAETLPRRE